MSAEYPLSGFNRRVLSAVPLRPALVSTSVSVDSLRALQDDPTRDIVPDLINALSMPDFQVRCYAAEMLRHFPSQRAVVPLLPLVQDPSEWVRMEAVETLGFLRDVRAIPTLISAASDEDECVRVNVAEALGAIRCTHPDVTGTLIALLEDDDSVVRAFAAEALGDLRDQTAIPALRTREQDEAIVRVWVCYALARLGEPFDWNTLMVLLAGADSNVRWQCVLVLRLMATDETAPQVADVFRRTLVHETNVALRDRLKECLRDLETANVMG